MFRRSGDIKFSAYTLSDDIHFYQEAALAAAVLVSVVPLPNHIPFHSFCPPTELNLESFPARHVLRLKSGLVKPDCSHNVEIFLVTQALFGRQSQSKMVNVVDPEGGGL